MSEVCLSCKSKNVKMWGGSSTKERLYCMECGAVFEKKANGQWKLVTFQEIKKKGKNK